MRDFRRPDSVWGANSVAVQRPLRGLRWVYTSNPFYIVGAGLMFIGFRLSFDASQSHQAVWLMLGLTALAFLLAVTAVLLVRWGKVWDDARSLMLLVVLVSLSISVTFDDALAAGGGGWYYLIGLAFTLLVSELVLRGTGLRMPGWFRFAYYTLLAVFFLYPLCLEPLIHHFDKRTLHLGLYAFSPVAGLAFLSLLPAIRRRPEYASKNGSPWQWPWYPWSLFALLAFCATVRVYYVCASFSMFDIFEPYFLAPLLLSLTIVVMELGVVSGHRGTQRAGLLLPAALLLVSHSGPRTSADGAYFLEQYIELLGATPLFFVLAALIGYYLWQSWRGIRGAYPLLLVAIALLSVVEPASRGWHQLAEPRGGPLLVVCALLLVRGVTQGRSQVFAWASLVGAVGLASEFHDKADPITLGLTLIHLTAISLIITGTCLHDTFAGGLRKLGPWLVLSCWLATMLAGITLAGFSLEFLLAYNAAWMALTVAFGHWFGGRAYQLAAVLVLGCWLAVGGWKSYVVVRRHVAGLEYILGGALLFVAATTISVIKAYRLRRRVAES